MGISLAHNSETKEMLTNHFGLEVKQDLNMVLKVIYEMNEKAYLADCSIGTL